MVQNIYSVKEIALSLLGETTTATAMLLGIKLAETKRNDPRGLGNSIRDIYSRYGAPSQNPRNSNTDIAITHTGLREIAKNGTIDINGKSFGIDWEKLNQLANDNGIASITLGNAVDPNRTQVPQR